jgi:hypothetical protein
LKLHKGDLVRVISAKKAKKKKVLGHKELEDLEYLWRVLGEDKHVITWFGCYCDICRYWGHAVINICEENPVCRSADHKIRPALKIITIDGTNYLARYFRHV